MIDKLYIVDFDRTLVDSDIINKYLNESVEKVTGISPSVMTMADHQARESGGSFDTLQFLRQLVSPEQMHAIKESFFAITAQKAKQKKVLFEPGAFELVQRLPNILIMTYGGQEWQEWKIEASGLGGEWYIITDHKEKGRFLAEAYDGERFVIDGVMNFNGSIVASSIELTDDKADSFSSFPTHHATGNWYVPKGRVLQKSQQLRGELPDNVKVIESLHQVAEKDV